MFINPPTSSILLFSMTIFCSKLSFSSRDNVTWFWSFSILLDFSISVFCKSVSSFLKFWILKIWRKKIFCWKNYKIQLNIYFIISLTLMFLIFYFFINNLTIQLSHFIFKKFNSLNRTMFTLFYFKFELKNFKNHRFKLEKNKRNSLWLNHN